MQASVPTHRIDLDSAALAHFMPMHLLLDDAGRALSFGPTLARVLQDMAVPGARFEDLFEVRSPGGAVTVADVLARAGSRFRLLPRSGVRAGLRGLGLRIPEAGRILLNLSFGIDLISAVRDLALTDADFAATDLAMELLYLAEANAAVTRELRGLNVRLEGARMAAEETSLTDPLTGLRNRRATDLVLERLCAARIGGDEFVVVIVGRSDPKSLQSIAERIIARISQPMEFEGQVCRVSASIGILRSTDFAVPEAAQLLSTADRALYAAKHAGRGRAVLLVSRGD